MSSEVDLTIRQAVPNDAKSLINFLNQTKDKSTVYAYVSTPIINEISKQKVNLHNIYESNNNVVIGALDGEELAGLVSINGGAPLVTEHIGELGIIVGENYRGMGLGTILMEEVIDWAKEDSIIRRIELKVQKRNHRAVGLYEKVGFKNEAVLERGARIDGQFLDVFLMSYLN